MGREKVTAFALYSSRKGWLGGALYATREAAEDMLREFLAAGPSVSDYDSVIELNGEPVARTDSAPQTTPLGMRWNRSTQP